MKVKTDENGGTIIELPQFKPAVVKIGISGALIFSVAMTAGSWIWAASSKTKDLENLKVRVQPLPEQVQVNTISIQENRRMMKALLKQLALLCEKQDVEILYEAEDFFNDADER